MKNRNIVLICPDCLKERSVQVSGKYGKKCRDCRKRKTKRIKTKKICPLCKINLMDNRSEKCFSCTGKKDRKKLSNNTAYNSYKSMINRCRDKENKKYFKNYISKGISVCDEWLNSFESFLRDMGNRPEGSSLDRIDNIQGYSKENCRWATRIQQNRNKSTNKVLSAFGKKMTLKEWSIEKNINHDTLNKRLKYGWPIEKALTEPVKALKSKISYDKD